MKVEVRFKSVNWTSEIFSPGDSSSTRTGKIISVCVCVCVYSCHQCYVLCALVTMDYVCTSVAIYVCMYVCIEIVHVYV